MLSKPRIIALLLLFFQLAGAGTINGFNLDQASVPIAEILSGGPVKDGIPAIDQPKFVTAEQATELNDNDRLLGIVINGQAKAYPINILNWHELVNDSIAGKHFLITYCPLCGTGIAFSSEVDGKTLTFGVSGLLYQSDMLFYDRSSESLWTQILGEAITGRFNGKTLQPLPLRHTSWSEWKAIHPNTQVLSRDTGYSRDYQRNPYAGYALSRQLYFSVLNQSTLNYHPKETVIGIEIAGNYKAYPFSELKKQGKPQFTDHLGGKEILVHWNGDIPSAHITDRNNHLLTATTGFWFAWYAFHSATEIYTAAE